MEDVRMKVKVTEQRRTQGYETRALCTWALHTMGEVRVQEGTVS